MLEVVPLEKSYRLVGFGPVLLVSTVGGSPDRPDVAAIAWYCPIEREPARFALCISMEHKTFENLLSSGDLVLNVPGADLADAVLRAGSVSGRDVEDKFAYAGLTPAPAQQVSAPRVAECMAWIECRLVDRSLSDPHGIVIVEGVGAWCRPGLLDEGGRVDVVRHPSLHHLGGDWFMSSGQPVQGHDREDA